MSTSLTNVRIGFLGGLGEIGRNCMVIEQDLDDRRSILVIDCGIMFPDADMHGIDLVLPDFTYLKEHALEIDGLVVTHGHEDHMGAIQFLLRDDDGIGSLRREPLPLYGSALALGLARGRIEEAKVLDRLDMRPVTDGAVENIGAFSVEFIAATHSVPHAHALAITTAQGVILHSGDFKIDLTPIDGRRMDLARIGQISKTAGIRLLLADSTNAEVPGYSPSESTVGANLEPIFRAAKGRRIIATCTASHIHRVQQLADAAISCDRKIATLGLSMMRNVRLGMDLGVLKIPESSLIRIEDVDVHRPEEVCIISTGSQGEPRSALSLLARDENRFVKLGPSDTVVLSSHAIPGNEANVNGLIDRLLRRGAQIAHSGVSDIHATGHAQAEELKTYMSIAQPEWFVPIHGEYRHMVANAALAERMSIPRTKVLLSEDGDLLELSADGLAYKGRLPASYVYVDGTIGDVGQGVIRDRRELRDEGMVVVVVVVDIENRTILTGPDIITRGWVYAPEAEEILDAACDRVSAGVQSALDSGIRDVAGLEAATRKATAAFVSSETRRRPMIVPVVLET